MGTSTSAPIHPSPLSRKKQSSFFESSKTILAHALGDTEPRIAVLGLRKCGKTCLIHSIKQLLDTVPSIKQEIPSYYPPPTNKPQLTRVETGNSSYLIVDAIDKSSVVIQRNVVLPSEGQKSNMLACMYLIDSSDPYALPRVAEDLKELYSTLPDDIPFVFVATKQNLPTKVYDVYYLEKELKHFFEMMETQKGSSSSFRPYAWLSWHENPTEKMQLDMIKWWRQVQKHKI